MLGAELLLLCEVCSVLEGAERVVAACNRRAFSARSSSSVLRSATEADPGTGGADAPEDDDDDDAADVDDASDGACAGLAAGLAAGFAACFAADFAVGFAADRGARLDHCLFHAAHSSGVYSSLCPCFGRGAGVTGAGDGGTDDELSVRCLLADGSSDISWTSGPGMTVVGAGAGVLSASRLRMSIACGSSPASVIATGLPVARAVYLASAA